MANEGVTEAVNYLIEAPDAAKLIDSINWAIRTWETTPKVFAGKAKCLNALLDVGLQDHDAYERLLRLVRTKRAGA